MRWSFAGGMMKCQILGSSWLCLFKIADPESILDGPRYTWQRNRWVLCERDPFDVKVNANAQTVNEAVVPRFCMEWFTAMSWVFNDGFRDIIIRRCCLMLLLWFMLFCWQQRQFAISARGPDAKGTSGRRWVWSHHASSGGQCERKGAANVSRCVLKSWSQSQLNLLSLCCVLWQHDWSSTGIIQRTGTSKWCNMSFPQNSAVHTVVSCVPTLVFWWSGWEGRLLSGGIALPDHGRCLGSRSNSWRYKNLCAFWGSASCRSSYWWMAMPGLGKLFVRWLMIFGLLNVASFWQGLSSSGNQLGMSDA